MHKQPALAADLPAISAKAEAEFDRRVRLRFPVGSSSATAESDLEKDGFGKANDFKDSRYVRLDRSAGFLIEEDLTVMWHADAAGRIVSIHGTYGLTGP